MKVKNELVKAALEARKKSYSPYSKYKVGAAVLGASGKIYAGTNVENASYGLTICAERSAIFNAVSSGEKAIKAIAVTEHPCGACRQVINEFAKPNTPVYIARIKNGKPAADEYKLKDYLPFPFGPGSLPL